MGIPTEYDHPDFIDVVENIAHTCRRHGVGVGLHMPLLRFDQQIVRRFFDAGMNWIINGADITVMRDAMNAQLRELRQLAGDPSFQEATASNPELEPVQACIT